MLYLAEHVAVVGATGEGKTVFTLHGLVPYLKNIYKDVPVYILDSTSDPNMDHLVPHAIHVEGNHEPDLLRSADRPLIWTPNNSKIPIAYARWFDKLIDAREPMIVVIDEIASITKQALEGLETLFKQLRKHGGTVIAETQRIAKVDTDVFSQITHFFLFRINPERYDMQMARAYLKMPEESFHMPGQKYGFWYRKTRTDYPAEEYAGFRHFFGDSFLDAKE